MPDRFTLLTLSFSFILHNVCSWSVSEPLNHTINDDGSISVTCMYDEKETFDSEAKLKMNNNVICEVYDKTQEQKEPTCEWHKEGNKFTFTLMKPEGILKNTFFCEISKIKPLPIDIKTGPETKLLRGCHAPLAPPKNSHPFPNQTHNQDHMALERAVLEDKYILLICGLITAVVMLTLYSIILTVFYIRLKERSIHRSRTAYNCSDSHSDGTHSTAENLLDKNFESSDNLTYVPMQRNINRHNLDNTDYVDMREVQKRGGSHRDMNHNSQIPF